MLAAHERGDRIALRTSGTAGAPRTVLRSTASWVASFPHVSALLDLHAGARVWVPGPLTATMNLFAAVHAAYTGARVVPTAEGATHAHLTPAALARALADPETRARLGGAHVLVAGDRLGAGRRAAAVAAGLRVSHYYGAAELSFVAWGEHADALRPFPDVEVRSQDGLLWVRSPFLSLGYADGGPGPFRLRPDGFATVGDRGAALADGSVSVSGRGDDAVTTAGATVLVADVEAALRAPAPGGAAPPGELVVLGLPHPDLGQVLAAVLTAPGALSLLRARARDALAPAQRPRVWYAVARLPTTPAGKTDRAALARRLVPPADGVRRLV